MTNRYPASGYEAGFFIFVGVKHQLYISPTYLKFDSICDPGKKSNAGNLSILGLVYSISLILPDYGLSQYNKT